MTTDRKIGGWFACGLLVVAAGCWGNGDRPELGEVSGVVNLNGKPLPFAGVHFLPEGGGRTSSGFTNQNGEFELVYIQFPREVTGSKIGMNRVVITTIVDASDLKGISGAPTEDEFDEDGGKIKERVPKCYRGSESILKVDVKEGNNRIKFDMTDDCSETGLEY